MFGAYPPKSLGYCMKIALHDSLHSLNQNIHFATKLSRTSYENLIEMVSHINQLCFTTFGEKCSFVKFALKKQSENLFWKMSTKVFCKISKENHPIYRTFELLEFLRLYDDILHFKSLVDSQPQMPYNASEVSDDPCCICLDREPDTVLPCMHEFCRPCINKWAGFSYQLPSQSSGQGSGSCSSSDINRTQCPICRSTYKNISTSWELISAKSPKSHRRQISGIVLRLISRTGRPSDTFPEVDSDGVTDGNEETSFTVIGHKHNPAENV
ncbi:RING finger protein [Schistosoma japonicum]|uniref:RING finger protein n=1 Tax=Schistosoma japonicum TaxID=6182 RepID=C1L8B4_SCHJA|nr:RING finger protein [Schistosoma japonicum]TNN12877.1 RING finger protein [Schistosoma japonicum]TNN12878.1 RING finger protein [Schistosoma japonicum]CAX70942.1 putative ring finger protein 141 [Schistosoma japonicum]